ncbi:MAG: NPCBM/NEW2 domain-containing protein [Clostridia bacterium]|nr:NPCBM/NEW2 domain-containing protein [Clostridia bacterium]
MKKLQRAMAIMLTVVLVLSAFSAFSLVFGAEKEYYAVYLDELKFTECVIEDNGKGKPIYDKNYTGSALTVNGTAYKKGIWSHPRADEPFILTYDIEGAGFDRFRAYVGPEDKGYGATEFIVIADGVEVWNSGIVKKGDGKDAALVDIDLSGVKTLTLKQTDGGDSYGGDSGCWGEAAFLKEKSGGAVIITSPAASDIYKEYYLALATDVTVSGISTAEKVKVFVNGTAASEEIAVADGTFSVDISGLTAHKYEISVRGYIGGTETGSDTITYTRGGDIALLNGVRFANDTEAVRDKNDDGKALSVGSHISKNGFAIKPANGAAEESYKDIVFNIEGGNYKYFSAVAGISSTANAGTKGTAELIVLADDKVIYSSGEVKYGEINYVTADIPEGTKTLTLRVGNYDGKNTNAVVNWCDPMLVKDKDTLTREGESLYEGLKTTKKLEMKNLFVQLKTVEDFVGVTLKTNAKGKVKISIYSFDYSVKKTLGMAPIATLESEVKDGKAAFNLFKVLPAGEYLITVAGNGSLDFYSEGVGTVYVGSEMQTGIVSMSINFTASGADLLSETVGNSGMEYISTKTSKTEKEKVQGILAAYTSDMTKFPFSVKIGGKKYSGFGEGFTFVSKTDFVKDSAKKKETATYIYDHEAGLRFTLLLDYYKDNAALSWTVYVKNTSNANSPTITEFYSADIIFEGENPYIYTMGGCGSYYTPKEIAVNSAVQFAESTGRSTETAWPYYNFMYGDGGTYLAIGWTGNWASSFTPDGNGNVNFRAYQKELNGYLKPGEEIRSPLVASVYYEGRDYDRSVNVWRRFMIDCISVRDENNELMQPVTAVYTGQFTGEMGSATEAQQIATMEAYINNGIKLDYWWMDALWHTDFSFWQADLNRFPTALKSISEKAALYNMKTMLWFAPETTTYNKSTAPKGEIDGTTLNPDWIIEGYATSSNLNLMDMTNPDAVEFLKTRIIKAMEAGGISIYREDMNYLPGVDWINIHKADPTRSGVFENLYVQGRYDLWDGLRDHFPGLFIDTCASGGNRLDLETMTRANPLHRIDFYGYFSDDSARLQSQTLSLMQWLPYNGVMLASQDNNAFTKYRLRSSMTPWAAYATNPANNPDWDVARQWQDEKARTDEYIYDDYYALTEWSYDETDWCAYEYFSEDKQSGYALVFRRAECDATENIKLKGLDPSKNYIITFEDAGYSTVVKGFDLLYNGIDVTLPSAESSEIIWIKEGNRADVSSVKVTLNASHSEKKNKTNTVIDLFATENGNMRFSLHLSKSLVNIAVAKGADPIVDLEAKYYDIFLINGKKLSEIEGAVLKYDLVNNFVDFYIPESSGITLANDFELTVDGSAKTGYGIKLYGEYTFSWNAATRTLDTSVVPNANGTSFGLIAAVSAGVVALAAAAAFIFIKKKKA